MVDLGCGRNQSGHIDWLDLRPLVGLHAQMLRAKEPAVNVDQVKACVLGTPMLLTKQRNLLVNDKHVDAAGAVTDHSNRLNFMLSLSLLPLLLIELLPSVGCLSLLALSMLRYLGRNTE